ncbi:MAG: HAD family phosphatase [Chitinophagaceae bacterium]|nr:HAD family phosphatase [Chitinophagaceae bacterium]
MQEMPLFGAAFDLDGTMLDNNPFHILAWQEFYRKRGRSLSTEEYKANFNGKTNVDVLRYVLEREPSPEEIYTLTDEKEGLYREIYAAHIKPVDGLLDLLELFRSRNIPMVIATSGIPVNIAYMFKHVPVEPYFKTVVNSTHISHGKPHPEIYQVAARELGLAPERCIAFEDATVGIRSAAGAGMKVVALTTTHTAEELHGADLIVPDFTSLNLDKLADLVSGRRG